jgi:hypothetical protein
MDIALPDKTYPVHVEGVDSGVVESEVNLPSDLRLRHVAVEQLLDALQRNRAPIKHHVKKLSRSAIYEFP